MKSCDNTRYGGIQLDFDNLFDHLFGEMKSKASVSKWMPAGEVTETDKGYQLVLELPGVSKDDVSIEMQENEMVISGEKRIPEHEDGVKRLRQERRAGSFHRSFEFGTLVDTDNVTASFENGLLTINVPKSEKAVPRKIEIAS